MRTRINTAREDRDQGFTLIELLVVVIIIGILAAIAIPVFLNQRKKGVDASIKSDLKNAAIQVETWATDYPSYAIPDESLTAGAAGGTTVSSTAGALNGFKASPGNTISLVHNNATTPKVGAYCIFGWNAGASSATSATAQMKYDSAVGGLQTGTSAGGLANCVS